MLNLQHIVKSFKEHPGIGFISFTYLNAKKETAKRLINIGAKYDNLLRADQKTLNEGDIEYISSTLYTQSDWNTALNQLKNENLKNILNRKKTRNSCNRSKGQTEAYVYICNGLRWHINNQRLYIDGSTVRKTLLSSDNKLKPTKKSAPVSIAKEIIRNTYLKTSKKRRFIVSSETLVGDIKINGEVIEIG